MFWSILFSHCFFNPSLVKSYSRLALSIKLRLLKSIPFRLGWLKLLSWNAFSKWYFTSFFICFTSSSLLFGVLIKTILLLLLAIHPCMKEIVVWLSIFDPLLSRFLFDHALFIILLFLDNVGCLLIIKFSTSLSIFKSIHLKISIFHHFNISFICLNFFYEEPKIYKNYYII